VPAAGSTGELFMTENDKRKGIESLRERYRAEGKRLLERSNAGEGIRLQRAREPYPFEKQVQYGVVVFETAEILEVDWNHVQHYSLDIPKNYLLEVGS
jgi:hypothetical protein